MKIKEICEKTGLTDRTVRYYIEEALISLFIPKIILDENPSIFQSKTSKD